MYNWILKQLDAVSRLDYETARMSAWNEGWQAGYRKARRDGADLAEWVKNLPDESFTSPSSTSDLPSSLKGKHDE